MIKYILKDTDKYPGITGEGAKGFHALPGMLPPTFSYLSRSSLGPVL
jgi:hypothetical protein